MTPAGQSLGLAHHEWLALDVGLRPSSLRVAQAQPPTPGAALERVVKVEWSPGEDALWSIALSAYSRALPGLGGF